MTDYLTIYRKGKKLRLDEEQRKQRESDRYTEAFIYNLKTCLIAALKKGQKSCSLEPHPTSRIDRKKIIAAFPECYVFFNDNECTTEELSVELTLKLPEGEE